jgi:hypothetical protein
MLIWCKQGCFICLYGVNKDGFMCLFGTNNDIFICLSGVSMHVSYIYLV